MLAIVLGSGLKDITNHLTIKRSIPYESFVDFDIKPLEGHERIVHETSLGDKSIIVLSGKLHLYEGYTSSQCLAPLRYVSNKYNIMNWLITSASGSFNRNTKVGEWQRISSIFTLENISELKGSKNFNLSKNAIGKTYAFQKGPSLGTVAEYKMLSKFGADMVGMSMLPESVFLSSIKSEFDLYSLPVCSYASMNYNIMEPAHEQVIEVAQKGIPDLMLILHKKINSQ